MTMTITAVLGSVCAVALLLLVYPYVIYPLVLRLLRRKPVKAAPVDLSVSLLFCAFNEMKGLPAKLDNLRALKRARPDLQILAYDDNSSDGTYELLVAQPELLTVVRGPGRTGKASGMKRLAKHATGDILVITDADGLLAGDAVERLIPYYADPAVGGVCGVLRCSAGDSVTAQIGSSYWGLDEKLRDLESQTGNVMGAMGALFSVRRSLYPDFPDTVADDFTVSMSVVFQGKRLIKASDVVVYHESCVDRAEEIRRKIRIGARAYHTHSFLRPQLRRMSAIDRFKYISRKQIRWFGGLYLAVAAVSGLGVVATISPGAAALVALILVAAVSASSRVNGGYVAKGSEALLLTFATFFGVLKAMRGQTVTTWSPRQLTVTTQATPGVS
jgi:cellulose synthase/poly-beta-1,6-N-acetylglucosamine synthase-like glycosyltransferase